MKTYLAVLSIVLIPVSILFLGTAYTGKSQPTAIPSVEKSPDKSPYEMALNSTVKIRYNRNTPIGRQAATATGVLVQIDNEQFVWTVAHTFQDNPLASGTSGYGLSTDIGVETHRFDKQTNNWSQCYRDAGIISLDPDIDVCLLKVTDNFPSEIVPSVVFDAREYPVRVGDRVLHVGNTSFEVQVVSEGILSSERRFLPVNGDDRLSELFQFESRIWLGSSGGGVYDASTGNCIGLASVLSTNMTYYGVPSSVIAKWADANGLGKYLPRTQ